MEVVTPHHSQITPGNSPRCMFSVKAEITDDANSGLGDKKRTISKDDPSLKYESKTENEKTQAEEQDGESTFVNSDAVQSTLSENSFESSKTIAGKPSEKDRKQMEFLLKGLPMLGQIFELHHKVGEGTFSSVFLATIRGIHTSQFANKQLAIKHLVPTTHPSRAERELRCLREIGGKDNVIGVHLCLRNADFIAFVMPYLPHRRFSEYVLDMGAEETRLYMRNLLLALCRVHAFNIIHRDVKPSNFLYNRETKEFLLVDFGLSQPVEETAPRPASSSKEPESSSVDRKRKRDEVEVNSSVSKTDGASVKRGSQNAVPENVTKRRALQPCNHNTLNIMKTPEKGPRYQVENKIIPPVSARAKNLQNITNTNTNTNVQKAAVNLKNVLKSPPKDSTDNSSTRRTPRTTKLLAGENYLKSPTKPLDAGQQNKASSFGANNIWKDNCDENKSRSKFAAGVSKIKADLEARRNGLKEPLQRKILFDDFPDPKPNETRTFAESRSASILRRSLNVDSCKAAKETVPRSEVMQLVRSPQGPLSTGKASSNKASLNGPEFRTLAPEAVKDPQPGSSIVRVQNSQVKSQQRSPVTPSESRKLLFQTSREKVVFAKPHVPLPNAPGTHCGCFGKPQVCTNCLIRKPQAAPRAGTPGFRPPEVLLRSPVQTTAVDMWAAGVILLCILSGCYPFFRSPDDLTALAEIMTVFGTQNIKEIAKRLGRLVVCSQPSKPLDLKKLCIRMRRRRKDRSHQEEGEKCLNCCQAIHPDTGCVCLATETNPRSIRPEDVNNENTDNAFPDTAYHLLARLLDLNPDTRITAADALTHPFVRINERND